MRKDPPLVFCYEISEDQANQGKILRASREEKAGHPPSNENQTPSEDHRAGSSKF